MTRLRRTRTILALFATVPMTWLATANASDETPVARWSDEVWATARQGDEASLDRLLNSFPADDVTEKYASGFQRSLKLRDENETRASSAEAESREEAVAELQKHLADRNITEGLRAAIQVQEFSGDFDNAFDNAEVKRLIAWAKEQVPAVEADSDWLQAQELLYLLRTLHEDTDRHLEYERWDRQLDAVNRRLSLLAQYAPRHLHDLRVKAAERKDEEIGEFNPGTALDWQERIRDLDVRMLRSALRIAATEHIETHNDRGWRVLLEGGLDALKIFATTPGLRESFPTLADEFAVRRWVRAIEDELDKLARRENRELDGATMLRIIDRLLAVNDDSVELPVRVVYREFGDGAVYKFDELFDDPYSEIIWPNKLRRFRQATEGNFIGVGILIRHNEKREIVVVNPLEGTPAYFAGVKPNDLIMEVDGESAVAWSLNDAVDKITGPKGEIVTLGLRREGEEELVELPINRDVIKLRTVKGWWKKDLTPEGDPIWDWYVDPVSRIAYIRLTQFTEDTYRDLRMAWAELEQQGRPNGLILDLRYNPGGLLTSAVDISNLFVQDGIIVTGEDKHGQKAFPDQKADPRHARLFGVPTAVLINKGSASASEIVAGCLQAHDAALIVGERSYGKGSVQTVHHISRKARLKLTTHYYRLPAEAGEEKGRLVHKRPGATMWGVEPDIEVRMAAQQVRDSIELRQKADIIAIDDAGNADADQERTDINDLLVDGLDPQLQMALLILQARAMGTVDDSSRHARR